MNFTWIEFIFSNPNIKFLESINLRGDLSNYTEISHCHRDKFEKHLRCWAPVADLHRSLLTDESYVPSETQPYLVIRLLQLHFILFHQIDYKRALAED